MTDTGLSESGPLITVVIPTYNSASFLIQTVESVLAQNWPCIELIVVDDGSDDDTRSLLEPYQSRLTYIYQQNFGGPSRARNVGVERASGEWIALFDSDDLMHPAKLAQQVAVIRANPKVDFIFTDFGVIDEQARTIEPRFVRRYQEFRAVLRKTDDEAVWLATGAELYPQLLSHNFIGTSSVLVRKSALSEAGGFDETIKNGDDRDMWYRLARAERLFAFLDVVGHSYRKREGNITSTAWRRIPAQLKVLERQRPFAQSPADRLVLDERIRATTLAYAWSLRSTGQPKEALEQYRRANALKHSWKAYRGILRCWITLVLRTGS